MAAPKKGVAKGGDDGNGVLQVKLIEGKNLAAMDKGGTSDPYCIITSSFNKQRFKSKIVKKTLNPKWDQEFKFYVSQPTGHILIKLWDKDALWDDKLGEFSVAVKPLENGDVIDAWYQLENEPKKKKGSGANHKGEVHLRLHFPSGKKDTSTVSTPVHTPQKEKEPKVEKPKRLADAYDVGRELGRGGFSVVKEATRRTTKEVFAVKIIEKNQAADELQLLQREIDIMHKLRHPNIISLEEVFDEPENIYLVLELVTGGELFDQIVSRGMYSERDAANIVRQILEAVAYMHENGIAHRDLKPENLLLSGTNSDVVKVTDFGLSKDFGTGTLRTSCGTPDYVAPEVLKGQPYDNSVDIWSIGVITYILLCGFPPFYGNTDPQIFEKILKAQYDFPSPDWDNVSDDAKQFISAILKLDPNTRPSALDCLEAPWILSQAPASPILSRVDSKLAEYNEKRKKAIPSQQ